MSLLYATPTVNSFMDYLSYMNTITGGLFWTIAVLVIFLVLFVAFSVFDFKKAAFGSTFVTLVLAILLRMGGLVSDWLVGVLIIMLALMGLYAMMTRNNA